MPAKSSTRIGAYNLGIDVRLEPAKSAAARHHVNLSLCEDVPVGAVVATVTQTVNTKRSLKPRQPAVMGSAQLSSANGVADYRVFVAR